jgi:hypothetical protein
MVASQKFATQVYEQAAQDGQYAQATPSDADSSTDEVVDAEVIDEDQQ